MTIAFRGPNFSRSRSGWTPDALKSGLQKYVRRGDWRMAARCAWEMLEFSAEAVTAAERTTGRALRTNVLNRVLICAAEDVGSADPVRMASAMRTALSLLARPRGDARAELAELVAALRTLCGSRKVRNVSVLRSLLVKTPAQFPGLASLSVDRGIAAGLTADEVTALRAGLDAEATGPVVPGRTLEPGDRSKLDDTVLALLCEDVSEEVAEAGLATYEHLLAGRWAVIPAALRLLETGPATKGARRSVARVFWSMLRAVATATSAASGAPEALEVLDVLEAAHGRTRESDVYVITALELCLAYGRAEWRDAIEAPAGPPVAEPYQADAIAGCEDRLELDPFVLDVHTRVGRAAGRSALDFVVEGSVVMPERSIAPRPLAKALYAARKLYEDSGPDAETVAALRVRLAAVETLAADERRQSGALLEILASLAPGEAAPTARGRSRTIRRATREAPVDAATLSIPDVMPEYTSADFEVLGTMIGCVGGKKPLLRKIRMRADGSVSLLKPVKDGFYAWVDGQKARCGLEPIGMEIVRVDGALGVRMRLVEGAVNLSRMPREGGRPWYADPAVRRDFLRIALFRVALHVSDTSPYNTLAYRTADGGLGLVSIDEMATTARHDTPRVLGGPRAAAAMRDHDLAWARDVVADWERRVGPPLDHAYLRESFAKLLGWDW